MLASEMRKLPEQELKGKAEEMREETFNLRFKATTEPVTNPARLREMRTDMARIETVLWEKAHEGKPKRTKLSRAARKRTKSVGAKKTKQSE